MLAADNVHTVRHLECIAIEMRRGSISAAERKVSAYAKIDEVRIVFVNLDAGVGQTEQVRRQGPVVPQPCKREAGGIDHSRTDAVVIPDYRGLRAHGLPG